MTQSPDDVTGRYVLAEDAPYLANLAALWNTDPKLAQQIEALSDVEDGSIAIEVARSGVPTASIASEAGRRIYLHSRYDPVGEARLLIDRAVGSERVAFFVFGFGLGYHLEQLLERSGDEALIFIFEHDIRLLRAALFARDLSDLLGSRRISILCSLDKSELLTRLTPHTALLSVGVESVVHPPSEQRGSAFYAQIRAWIEEFNSFGRTSMNTLLMNSTKTAENITRNIGWYTASPSLSRLNQAHQGRPAVIVSAGPSLRKNKHLLHDLKDRAVLIAVQTTLQPLLEMGIEPDYVTSLDYHEICTRFFERLPKTLRTELVAEPKASSAIMSMYPGPISFLGNPFADGLVKELRPERARLRGGATVAHLAYYLAEHLGCDPIIFVGQDLGFSDGLCYTPGTSYEDVWRPELGRFCTVEMKQWEQIVRERFILRRIPDYQGQPMYTEERLFSYLQQFERDFMKTSTRIIDATEGGAAKQGTTTMPLSEAIEKFCQPRDGAAVLTPIKHPGVNWARLPDTIDCLRRRQGEALEIQRISHDTLPLLCEIRDHLEDQSRVNRAIGALDGLRARMNELGACYDLVTQLTQTTELARFESDRKIAAARVNGTEKQRLQVSRDIENVRGVMEAAADFQKLMDQVIAELASATRAEAA